MEVWFGLKVSILNTIRFVIQHWHCHWFLWKYERFKTYHCDQRCKKWRLRAFAPLDAPHQAQPWRLDKSQHWTWHTEKNNVINCAFSAQSGSSFLNNIINCAFSAQSGSRVYSYYQLRLFSTIRVELFKQYYQLRFFSTIREPTAILRSCKWSMLGLVHPNFKSTTQGRTPVPSMEPSHCIMSNCIHKQPCGGILKIHPGWKHFSCLQEHLLRQMCTKKLCWRCFCHPSNIFLQTLPMNSFVAILTT